MEKLRAWKYELSPDSRQEVLLRQAAGCCRFVYNHALALEKETYEAGGRHIGYCELCGILADWKKDEAMKFLRKAPSQPLQQALKDLDRAYGNFFEKRAGFPHFKAKGVHDAFRYPQGFWVDEVRNCVYLPKIGWVKYRRSRDIEGRPKQVTVSRSAGKWFVSIQTEEQVPDPVHPSASWIGIDLGVARIVTMSDGTFIEPVNPFRGEEKKLARLQRQLARRKKYSLNWWRTKTRILRLHRRIANIRRDFINKVTTAISNNHAAVVIEDLKVRDMTASAAGTVENPGRSVRARSGLNKSILDQGWHEFRRQLEYKLRWLGGRLIVVPPRYTSQKCSRCGHVSAENRKTQARFRCVACGFEENADFNAALNILAAGRAAAACTSGETRNDSGTLPRQ